MKAGALAACNSVHCCSAPPVDWYWTIRVPLLWEDNGSARFLLLYTLVITELLFGCRVKRHSWLGLLFPCD